MMRPRDVKTWKHQLSLRRDNYDTKGHWLLLDPDSRSVIISAQTKGGERTATIDIPRGEFNRLVDWYMKSQKPRPTPK